MKNFLKILFFLLMPSVACAQTVGAPPIALLPTNQTTNTSSVGGTNWSSLVSPAHMTITLNTTDTTAPDGSSNATKFTNTETGSGVFTGVQNTPSPAMVANTNYAVSFFVKQGTNCCANIGPSDAIANAFGVFFNFNTLALTNTTAGTGSVIASGAYPYPNGWYRLWVVGKFTAVTNTEKVAVSPWNDTSGDITNNGSIYAWGAQTQKATYPSSYVPN